MSHTAYSNVQSALWAPAQRNLSWPGICGVSANLARSWELAGCARSITLTEQEQKNCFAHSYLKTAGSLSHRLKRRHTENAGVRLQERDRFRLQRVHPSSKCHTLHMDVLALQSWMHLSQSGHWVHGAFTLQGWEHLSLMHELFTKAKAEILAVVPHFL